MLGQWQGRFSGYSSGQLTIEIDENQSVYSGRICVFEDNNPIGVFAANFRTDDKQPVQKLKVHVSIQRHGSATEIPSQELAQLAPNVTFPDTAHVEIVLRQRDLRVTATAFVQQQPIGKLSAVLTKGSAEKPSKLKTNRKINTWDKFKTMVGQLEPDRYVFRGQSVGFRLRTSFHRTNRRDLFRFVSIDVPQLHATVTSKTNHYFDFRDDKQYAAFCNLLQHHGYPTPLLDWTHSPYVAAFFAYRERFSGDPKRKVRIFKFDSQAWQRDYHQIYSLVNVHPHFSFMTPVALENPRALPQQALCSITSVDDVESYLETAGTQMGKSYLEVFELPYSDRVSVLTELRLMGVAAGSLFPGIDGACEELKFKNFVF
ncbi:FRG domain-containing protein [Rhizobium sp. WYCCWR 11128]|uniref:FRG domain-containing protein n=1 Tax=Rhizobium sp. WYCCWR 11128 TaxID=2749832 RepID=UPI0015D19F1C|nr:FRG domain-containing protein [Rhizobium sp. WYCCWR 11128]NYT30771.1 FRG domain-containing protein [Rhizobium sp. WYCCWR 11128]